MTEYRSEESRAKTQFLARMSHEIRTPMNAVLGIVEMELQRGGHPPETENAFLRIQSSSGLLLSILNDILDFSKVEADKMEISAAPYELANMLVDTAQLNIMHIGGKHIKFELNVDENLPAYLVGDELRIRQVLNNVLSNAFKYTQQGSVSLDVSAEPGPDNNITILFRVQDTGQGMTEEQLERLFEIEYSRFNTESNRTVEGSGLGMNIAYRLVALMNGSIRAESRPGEGTTFFVRIPHIRESDVIIGKETAASLKNLKMVQRSLKRRTKLVYTPMPYGKVLVVDDVESNLYVARGLLQPYKLAIDTVSGGSEAIKKIEAGNIYDIIFMDYMMPGIDGVEAVKRIRAFGYTQPIVALTANIMLGQLDMFLKAGFNGFIAKPIDANQMNAYLLRFIRDKQSEEVLAATDVEHENHSFASKDISVRLKESFVRDAERSAAALTMLQNRKTWDSEELKLYVVHTHAMKSALANVGKDALSCQAAVLEYAARENDMPTIKALSPIFLKKLRLAALEYKGDSAQELAAQTDGANPTIFVVDDSDTNLIMATEALEDDYNLLTAVSAAKMFSLLEKWTPRLILMDIEMPEMNGFEAIRKLKQNPDRADIPVAFLTATLDAQKETEGRELGACGFIAKPFAPDILQSRVSAWLAAPPSRKPTVLIIDDTPIIIDELSKIIAPLHRVMVAIDGETGIKLAERHPVDLILLDLYMPGFSGFEVLERLKTYEKTRDIPVIVITGSEEARDEARGFALGAEDYIKKPFVASQVLHRMGLHIKNDD